MAIDMNKINEAINTQTYFEPLAAIHEDCLLRSINHHLSNKYGGTAHLHDFTICLMHHGYERNIGPDGKIVWEGVAWRDVQPEDVVPCRMCGYDEDYLHKEE